MRRESFGQAERSARPVSAGPTSVALIEAVEPRVLMSAGDLDFTFNGDGRAYATNSTTGGSGDVAIAPDGKVVVLRNTGARTTFSFDVGRLNTNGTPDASFGQGSGNVNVPFVVPAEGSE